MANPNSVTRRTVVALLLLFALAAPALGDDVAKKRQVDAKISHLQGSLAATRKSEAVLRSRISALDNRIGSLETQVGSASLQLASLQRDLSYRRQRLADLTRLFRLETRRLDALKKSPRRSTSCSARPRSTRRSTSSTTST